MSTSSTRLSIQTMFSTNGIRQEMPAPAAPIGWLGWYWFMIRCGLPKRTTTACLVSGTIGKALMQQADQDQRDDAAEQRAALDGVDHWPAPCTGAGS